MCFTPDKSCPHPLLVTGIASVGPSAPTPVKRRRPRCRRLLPSSPRRSTTTPQADARTRGGGHQRPTAEGPRGGERGREDERGVSWGVPNIPKHVLRGDVFFSTLFFLSIWGFKKITVCGSRQSTKRRQPVGSKDDPAIDRHSCCLGSGVVLG